MGDIWSVMGKTWVLEFYGHHPSQEYGCFSNFFASPFAFDVPEEFCSFPFSLEERTVACDFSEKAIMLCKAAIMGDRRSYQKIAASKAQPAVIKRMGREVEGFDQDLWSEIECSVAYQVVYQKFEKTENLKKKLLATEDWVIAEATSNDRNWGIGLDRGDQRVHNPALWQGTNLLGWALMEARKTLRGAAAIPEVMGKTAAHEIQPAFTGLDQAASSLTDQEKQFLKMAKKVREMFKLEELDAAGNTLDTTQRKKLESKHSLLSELIDLAKRLPPESELLSRNKDLMENVPAHVESP